MIKISVIITYYNQQDSLEVVLKSLEQQVDINMEYMEVVIVNDGSTLDKDIFTRFTSLNIKYIEHPKNLGRSATRNTGETAANGEVLIFIDGDRFVAPTFVKEHYNAHLHSKEIVVIGDIVEIFHNRIEFYHECLPIMFQQNNCKIWKFARRYNYAECVFKIFRENGTTISNTPWISLFSGNFSLRKETYEEIGGFDENYDSWGMENMEFGYRLCKNNIQFILNKKAVNFHIFHRQNRCLGENIKIRYLKRKYPNNKQFADYMKFISGEISLDVLENSKEQQNNIQPIYYSRNKLGSKYKYEEFVSTNSTSL